MVPSGYMQSRCSRASTRHGDIPPSPDLRIPREERRYIPPLPPFVQASTQFTTGATHPSATAICRPFSPRRFRQAMHLEGRDGDRRLFWIGGRLRLPTNPGIHSALVVQQQQQLPFPHSCSGLGRQASCSILDIFFFFFSHFVFFFRLLSFCMLLACWWNIRGGRSRWTGGALRMELGAFGFGLSPRRPVETEMNMDLGRVYGDIPRWTRRRGQRERWIGDEIRSSLRHIGLVMREALGLFLM